MRESIGATWIMGIVVFFIVLFSGFLALANNHSKAFHVKNAIVEIIERENGHTEEAVEAITEYLSRVGYNVGGNCNLGGQERGEGFLPLAGGGPRYCIATHEFESAERTQIMVQYTVTVFFQVDFPVLRSLFTFPVFGDTKTITFPGEGANPVPW